MGNWQTIETAPKDSSEFLAWNGGDFLITRWVSCLDEWDIDEYTPPPTHWQPLPPPPKEQP